MLVNVKDQDVMKIEKFVEDKSWTEARDFIDSLKLAKPLELYNKAFIEYKSGNHVNALKLLEEAKYSGLYSEEVLSAIAQIKSELNLTLVEEEISISDQFVLNSKTISDDFFLSLFSIFLVVFVALTYFKKYLVSVFFLLMTSLVGGYFYLIQNYEIAYNKKESVVYSGPSRIFEEKQIIPIGAKVIFTKSDNDWKFINYPKIFKGWVYQPEVLYK